MLNAKVFKTLDENALIIVFYFATMEKLQLIL